MNRVSNRNAALFAKRWATNEGIFKQGVVHQVFREYDSHDHQEANFFLGASVAGKTMHIVSIEIYAENDIEIIQDDRKKVNRVLKHRGFPSLEEMPEKSLPSRQEVLTHLMNSLVDIQDGPDWLVSVDRSESVVGADALATVLLDGSKGEHLIPIKVFSTRRRKANFCKRKPHVEIQRMAPLLISLTSTAVENRDLLFKALNGVRTRIASASSKQ